jgi:hypothetical protein
VTHRRVLVALAVVAAVVTTAVAVHAAAFYGWQVSGVSADDVLMVRAFPDSKSRILVGYPSGTPLSLTGRCTDGLDLAAVSGMPAATQTAAVAARWCEVWVDPVASGDWQAGWVFGRYIRPL